jgi:2-dehydro-3-deoxy-D-arabinonate dehydratase
VFDIGGQFESLSTWLSDSVNNVPGAIRRLARLIEMGEPVCSLSEIAADPGSEDRYLLPPVDRQEVWAAGVTYERSRQARQEESQDGGDVYARVYAADRPEIFFKAPAEKVVGPGAPVGIRRDADWSVPEPELALVLNPAMQVAGFTIGNDLSSRDIEGANPLYLPQAKVYTASCALGPAIRLVAAGSWPELAISISIERRGQVVFADSTSTSRLHRTLSDLSQYLGRSSQFPHGAVLLTGTGIVPPNDFTLAEGDIVSIEIETLGRLTNPVMVV